MNYYFYNFNCKAANTWLFVKTIKLGRLITSRKTCNQIRQHNVYSEIIPNTSGWHLTYFGDKEYIKNKLRSFSHTEYSEGKYVEDNYIEHMITQCKSLFPQPDIYQFEKVDGNAQEKPKLWSILIAETPII